MTAGPTELLPRLWAVVLAGGDGIRLRHLTRQIHGDDRPKQFARLVGSRSMLGHTLDRVGLAIPRERTVVVVRESHAAYLQPELAPYPGVHVVAQPENRGTAAGVLLPVHWITWRDPSAVIALFPSDHFVLESHTFMDHVLQVAEAVRAAPHWLTLLGAQPTTADSQYGWVEPGPLLQTLSTGPLYRAKRFWEKPAVDVAAAAFRKGWLWNTLVLVGSAMRLVDLGREMVPAVHAELSRIPLFARFYGEAEAVRRAYREAPSANFSRSVLEPCPPGLVVSQMPPVTWSDWGTPERVLSTLQHARLFPEWLAQVPAAEPVTAAGAPLLRTA
jgi:mannose-1-phosphate guanylyltransferase